MRVGVVADVHLWNHRQFGEPTEYAGVNTRALYTLRALEATVRGAFEGLGCAKLVVAGDLFHNPDPNPQLIEAAYRSFGPWAEHVVLAPGNHDMESEMPCHHAMTPLGIGGCTVADAAADDGRTVVLPYRRSDVLRYLEGLCHVAGKAVVGHFGIVHKGTPAHLRTSSEAVTEGALREWMRAEKVWAVVAGDWHRHYLSEKGGRCVVQVGALAPWSWSDSSTLGELHRSQDPYGKLIVLDFDERRVEVWTTPGPRFVRLALPHGTPVSQVEDRVFEAVRQLADAERYVLFFDITAPRERIEDAKGLAERLECDMPCTTHTRVREDVDLAAEVDKVRERVRKAQRLHDAVREYVTGTWGDVMDDEVLGLVDRFLDYGLDYGG